MLSRPCLKEFVHAFSCAYTELWMHLGSSEKEELLSACRLEQLLRFFRALQTSRMLPQLVR